MLYTFIDYPLLSTAGQYSSGNTPLKHAGSTQKPQTPDNQPSPWVEAVKLPGHFTATGFFGNLWTSSMRCNPCCCWRSTGCHDIVLAGRPTVTNYLWSEFKSFFFLLRSCASGDQKFVFHEVVHYGAFPWVDPGPFSVRRHFFPWGGYNRVQISHLSFRDRSTSGADDDGHLKVGQRLLLLFFCVCLRVLLYFEKKFMPEAATARTASF